MHSSIDVSVIVPVYKTEKYLRTCVDSILSQHYNNFEIILVDDGSPDGSPAICDDYSRNYKNVKVIHKANGGLSSARNAGVDAASGNYILFVDSDDTVEDNLLQSVVPIAEKDGADVVVFGINTIVTNKAGEINKAQRSFEYKIIDGKEKVRDHFLFLEKNDMWNQVYDKLYRRSTIVENGVRANSYFDKVCEDSVFLLDLFYYISTISIVPGVFYNYFIRKNQSIVTCFLPERYEKSYNKYKKIQDTALKINLPQKEKLDFLYENYCTHILWAYEFLFHDDYPYGLIKTYYYLKTTFSIRKESKSFCREAASYFAEHMSTKYSISSGFALRAILNNRYMTAWAWFLFTKMNVYRKARVASD